MYLKDEEEKETAVELRQWLRTPHRDFRKTLYTLNLDKAEEQTLG